MTTARRSAGAREHVLLRRCARARLTPEDAAALRAELADHPDWDALVDAAIEHGVAPLLYRHLDALRDMCFDSVPAGPLDRLRAEHALTVARNLRLAGELRRILSALTVRGVAALPYKGPVLAADVYGDVALRCFADLDILIAARDLPASRDVIAALGYEQEHARTPAQERQLLRTGNEESLVRGDDKVELQWCVAKDIFGVRITFDDLWPRHVTTMLGGAPVPTLANEDLLLVLCVHGSSHAWDRLIWITDVAELLRRTKGPYSPALDWERVCHAARDARAERALRLGVTLARELLDAPLPPEIARWASADASLPGLVSEVRRELSGEASGMRSIRVHLRVRETVRDKARFVVRALFTPAPADWSALPLPDGLHPLYHVIRPLRLVAKYGALAMRRFS
ncbi:MAG: nucleotidyltransferase family protein [Gemmatimonadaceae bacterium]